MVLPSVKTDLVEVTGKLGSPCRFLYKKENQQPSGSFKLRGMSKLISEAIENASSSGKTVHIFSSSGGNAGLAAAYVSKHYGVPCTVALPRTAKQAALDKLKILGANVTVYGAHWGETDTYLKQEIMATVPSSVEPIYCHPFDHVTLWDGHGDMVDEIVLQLKDMAIEVEKVKGIVCSCGGGGLYNGVMAGLQRNKSLSAVPMLVLETKQTPTFHSSVKADEVVTLSKIDTLSTSLAAPFIAQRTLDNYFQHKTTVELIDDLEAVEATVDFYDIFNEVIEPACGATAAISMKRKDLLGAFGNLSSDDVIIFIICGGSTVSPENLESYREMVGKK